MKTLSLPLVSDDADFPQTAPERTVNLFGAKVGKDQFILQGSPGLNLFGVLEGSGGIRGELRFKGTDERLFAVRGNSFQEWDTGTSAFIERGLLSSLIGQVGMTYHQTTAGVKQVVVVDGTKAYKYIAGTPGSFAEIPAVDPDPAYGFQGGGAGLVYASLRALSFTPGTGKIWCSDFDDIFRWKVIAGGVAETFPDPIVALASVGAVIFVFGTDSMEPWVDQGLPTFPFRRIQAGSPVGCSAPSSVSVYGQAAYWLGGTKEGRGQVYRTNGYSPERISTDEIERIIGGMASFDDAVGYIVQEEGHVFYVLNFGVGDRTLVYDISTGLWAEWEYRNGDGTLSRHPAIAQAVYNGLNLVGDARNGNIYEMAGKYLDNDGLLIVREKIFPCWPQDSYEFTSMPPFFLALDVGTTPSGADEPRAMLSWSDDRGKLYGMEVTRGLGLTGRYDIRPVWDGLGSSYGRAYRLRLTGPVKFTIREAGFIQ